MRAALLGALAAVLPVIVPAGAATAADSPPHTIGRGTVTSREVERHQIVTSEEVVEWAVVTESGPGRFRKLGHGTWSQRIDEACINAGGPCVDSFTFTSTRGGMLSGSAQFNDFDVFPTLTLQGTGAFAGWTATLTGGDFKLVGSGKHHPQRFVLLFQGSLQRPS